MADERCPVCDRVKASRDDLSGYFATSIYRERRGHAFDYEPEVCWAAAFIPGCAAPYIADCRAHAVDWRGRCKGAEAERDALYAELGCVLDACRLQGGYRFDPIATQAERLAKDRGIELSEATRAALEVAR